MLRTNTGINRSTDSLWKSRGLLHLVRAGPPLRQYPSAGVPVVHNTSVPKLHFRRKTKAFSAVQSRALAGRSRVSHGLLILHSGNA